MAMSFNTNMPRIVGLSSGMDTDAMVVQIMRAEGMRLNRLNQQRTLSMWRQEAYRDVASMLRDFSNTFAGSVAGVGATQSLRAPSNFRTLAAGVTRSIRAGEAGGGESSNLVRARAMDGAQIGSFDVHVVQAARGDVFVGRGIPLIATSDETFTMAQTRGLLRAGDSFGVVLDGGQQVNITLTEEDVRGTTNQVIDNINNRLRERFGMTLGQDGRPSDHQKVSVLIQANGHISFMAGAGHTVSVRDGDPNANALRKLGFEGAATTTFDLNVSVAATGFFGNHPAQTRMGFAINGVEFSFDRTDTLQDVMNAVNASSAGVRLHFDQFRSSFRMESTGTGHSSTISIRDSLAISPQNPPGMRIQNDFISQVFGISQHQTVQTGRTLIGNEWRSTSVTDPTQGVDGGVRHTGNSVPAWGRVPGTGGVIPDPDNPGQFIPNPVPPENFPGGSIFQAGQQFTVSAQIRVGGEYRDHHVTITLPEYIADENGDPFLDSNGNPVLIEHETAGAVLNWINARLRAETTVVNGQLGGGFGSENVVRLVQQPGFTMQPRQLRVDPDDNEIDPDYQIVDANGFVWDLARDEQGNFLSDPNDPASIVTDAADAHRTAVIVTDAMGRPIYDQVADEGTISFSFITGNGNNNVHVTGAPTVPELSISNMLTAIGFEENIAGDRGSFTVGITAQSTLFEAGALRGAQTSGEFSINVDGRYYTFRYDQWTTIQDLVDWFSQEDEDGNPIGLARYGFSMSFDERTDQFTLDISNVDLGLRITANDARYGFLQNIGINPHSLGGHSQTQRAENAIVRVDGAYLSRESNTFQVNGVELSISEAAAGSTFTIDVSRDIEPALELVMNFVNEYNTLIEELNRLNRTPRPRAQGAFYEPLSDEERRELSDREVEMWEERARTGMLFRSDVLSSIQQQFRSLMFAPVTLADGRRLSLSQIGITTSGDGGNIGLLQVDENRLRQALERDSEGVLELFTQTAPSTEFPGMTIQQRNARMSRQGIGMRINDIVRNANDHGGSIFRRAGIEGTASVANNLIHRDIARHDERIESMQNHLRQREEQLLRMFANMERSMATANNQMASIMSMLGIMG